MLNTSQCILICLREDIATTGPLWIARSPFARPTLTIGPWISIIELQSALSLLLAPGCHNFRLILIMLNKLSLKRECFDFLHLDYTLQVVSVFSSFPDLREI